jgi:hypothetical protein
MMKIDPLAFMFLDGVSLMRRIFTAVPTLALLLVFGASSARAADFMAFETGAVRPMVLSGEASRLFALNIPDNRLEVFSVDAQGLTVLGSVQVGMEPCALAQAPDGRLWVVNHLSDSVRGIGHTSWVLAQRPSLGVMLNS